MFSQPGSPVRKVDIPTTPVKIEKKMNLFSPTKNRETTGIRDNKYNAYMSNVPPSRRMRNYDDSNQTTRITSVRDTGNMTNERILSPTGRGNHGGSPMSPQNINKSGEAKTGRRYVANMVERELFRTTFLNQKDLSDTNLPNKTKIPRFDKTANLRKQL